MLDITTTHLEMHDPAAHRRARPPAEPLTLTRAELPSPELNRFLYVSVGGSFTWIGRLAWSRERWMSYLDRPELETWIGAVRGTPVGYFELERQGDQVQIMYFGLLPGHLGRGLGGALLSAAIDRAFELGPRRVWVHTCDLDHPSALPNYLARGFSVFSVERFEEEVPALTRAWWGDVVPEQPEGLLPPEEDE